MNPTFKNVLAVLAGIVLGSVVNMGIITISGFIVPPPEGVDSTSMDSLKTSMHLFQPKHFIMPFLAHAVGTLVGAIVAAKIAVNHKGKFAIAVGGFFLIGGITNVFILPSPVWFIILDLTLAYLPMGFIGGKLAK